MGICFRCDSEKGKLLDVVGQEGIVGVCGDCLGDEESPIVRKSLRSDFRGVNAKGSVYQRLGAIAGVDLEKHKKFEDRAHGKELENKELREIVEKKFSNSSDSLIDVNKDLIRNFHWVFMRARRLRKITLSELAREIKGPEVVLKMVEMGDVSQGSLELIRKLETYFGVEVLTDEARGKLDDFKRRIDFDSVFTKSLTIDDLRKMKREKEEEIFEKLDEKEKIETQDRERSLSNGVEEIFGERDNKQKKSELRIQNSEVESQKSCVENEGGGLSQKEIDDLIFGR